MRCFGSTALQLEDDPLAGIGNDEIVAGQDPCPDASVLFPRPFY
jgi:hypothetical protein